MLIDKCRVSFYLCIVKIQPAKKEHMPRTGSIISILSVTLLLLLSISSYAADFHRMSIERGIAACSYTSPPCSQISDPYKFNYKYNGISVVPGPWFPSLGGGIPAAELLAIRPCRLELRARVGSRSEQPSWSGGVTPKGFKYASFGRYSRDDPRDCLAAVSDLGVGIGDFSNTNMELFGWYAGLNYEVWVDIFLNDREYGKLYGWCITGQEYWRNCDAPDVSPTYYCNIDVPSTIDMGLIGLNTDPSEYSEQIKIQCSGPAVPNSVVLKIENDTTALGDGVLTSKLCDDQGAGCSSSVATGINSLVVMKFTAAGFLSPGPKSGYVIVTSSYN